MFPVISIIIYLQLIIIIGLITDSTSKHEAATLTTISIAVAICFLITVLISAFKSKAISDVKTSMLSIKLNSIIVA